MADQIDVPTMQKPKMQNMKTQNTGNMMQNQMPTNNTASQPMVEKKPMKGWVWFIIGLIVGIALAAGYFLFLA